MKNRNQSLQLYNNENKELSSGCEQIINEQQKDPHQNRNDSKFSFGMSWFK